MYIMLEENCLELRKFKAKPRFFYKWCVPILMGPEEESLDEVENLG